MAVDRVGRETDQLDATLGKFWLQFRKGSQLGCADGRIVLRVGEQNDPLGSDEFVEIDGAVGGVGLKIWCYRAKAQTGVRVSIWPSDCEAFKPSGTYGAGRSSVEDIFDYFSMG